MILVDDDSDNICWWCGIYCSYLVGYSVIWNNFQMVVFSKERTLFLTIGTMSYSLNASKYLQVLLSYYHVKSKDCLMGQTFGIGKWQQSYIFKIFA